jgi:hypothetical protein
MSSACSAMRCALRLCLRTTDLGYAAQRATPCRCGVRDAKKLWPRFQIADGAAGLFRPQFWGVELLFAKCSQGDAPGCNIASLQAFRES